MGELIALPCGHLLSKKAYIQMGGCIGNGNELENEEEEESKALIHITKAGQGGANGTYRKGKSKRFTKYGRYDGQDVDYFIEIKTVNFKRWWYLSCETGSNPNEASVVVEFYRAQVNESCDYPKGVKWEAATLFGTFPSPCVTVSY